MNKVKAEEFSVPLLPLEDEATEVKRLLEEPKNDYFSVDCVLCYDDESAGKFSEIKRSPNEVEYGFRINSGGFDSYLNPDGEDALNLGVLDGILDDIDEVEDLDCMNCPTTACEDFLLDVDFAQEFNALDHGPSDRPQLRNSNSDSHSPGYSGSSNGAVEMSESSAGTNLDLNHNDDSCKERITSEFHGGAQKPCFDNSTPNEDNKCLTLHDWTKADEFQNGLDSVASNSSRRNKNNCAAANIVSMRIRQKRQRKPTQRYIEESMNIKSIHLREEKKPSAVALKCKRAKFRTPDELHYVTSGVLTSVTVEDALKETIAETLSHPHVRRGTTEKHGKLMVMENDLEEYPSAYESEDDSVTKKAKKGVDRRKHQRMWTLPEVTKLVDGVSNCGAGKWTDIKRLFFATSAYRTPVDLRDKWRNLLRASHAIKSNKGKDEISEKNAVRPLPKTLLRQVRELAKIHPYPRKNQSRPSPIPSAKKGVTTGFCGRNIHRRSCA